MWGVWSLVKLILGEVFLGYFCSGIDSIKCDSKNGQANL